MITHSQPFKQVEKKLAGSAALRTDAQTSARMSRVRQRDTEPELRVRRACRSLGLHYRTRNRDLPGSPDLANRSRRWALFVHGCYWHRHASCAKATMPRRNTEFWMEKFSINVDRDRKARFELRKRGYRVFTILECEVERPERLRQRIGQFALSLAAQTNTKG